MDQEEHEVYGQEIPVDGGDVDMDPAEEDAVKVSGFHNPFSLLNPNPSCNLCDDLKFSPS